MTKYYSIQRIKATGFWGIFYKNSLAEHICFMSEQDAMEYFAVHYGR